MTANMTVQLAVQDEAAAAEELEAQKGWSRRRDKRAEALRERQKASRVLLTTVITHILDHHENGSVNTTEKDADTHTRTRTRTRTHTHTHTHTHIQMQLHTQTNAHALCSQSPSLTEVSMVRQGQRKKTDSELVATVSMMLGGKPFGQHRGNRETRRYAVPLQQTRALARARTHTLTHT